MRKDDYTMYPKFWIKTALYRYLPGGYGYYRYLRSYYDPGYVHERDKHPVRRKHCGSEGWSNHTQGSFLYRDYENYQEYEIHQRQKYDEILKGRGGFANKTVTSEPVLVYGHYEPSVIQETLSNFGIELTNDQMFIFNKSYIEKKLNRTPQIGDQITPEFQKQKYEIIEVQEDSFEMYGVYHILCTAKLLRESEDVMNQEVSDVADDLGGYIDL